MIFYVTRNSPFSRKRSESRRNPVHHYNVAAITANANISSSLVAYRACTHLCRSSSRCFDVCVSLLLFLKGGCVSTLLGSAPCFCCSERRHAAMTTAGVSSICSGYSPPRPRRCGGSSSKVDNRLLDLTAKQNEREKKKLKSQSVKFSNINTHGHTLCLVHTPSNCSITCHFLSLFSKACVWAGGDRKLNELLIKLYLFF